MFDVGEILLWTSRVLGELHVEYRGRYGTGEACVIIRESGRFPEQLLVPLSELSKL